MKTKVIYVALVNSHREADTIENMAQYTKIAHQVDRAESEYAGDLGHRGVDKGMVGWLGMVIRLRLW